MLGADARDLLGLLREKASAGLGDPGEPRPAGAAAPERRSAALKHHRRAIPRTVEIDRLKIFLLIEAQSVEHVARENHQSGAARAERDRLADEIVDRTG